MADERAGSQRQLLLDGAITVAFAAAAVVSLTVDLTIAERNDATYRAPPPMLLALTTAGLTLPLAWRRRRPLTVLCTVWVAFVLARLVGNPDVDIALFAIPFAAYSAGAWSDSPRRTTVFALSTAFGMSELSWELVREIPEYRGFLLAQVFDFAYNLTAFVVAWSLGTSTKQRREQRKQLERRATELERQREDNARRAVLEERVRLARELHDVIAHHVSVMGLQAGAARVALAQQPGRAAGALTQIESSGRAAVDELNRMLGVLRQSDEACDLAPQPGLADVDTLLARLPRGTVTARLSVEGPPRPLPRPLDVSAYRIVQEAVTNTLKHADARHLRVTMRYEPEWFELSVTDDGSAAPDPTPPALAESAAGGHGLLGMRERAAMHGGRLTAGPRSDGGYAVTARFPVGAA